VVTVGRNRCELQVLDDGRGIDPERLRAARRPHLRRPPVRPVQLLNRRGRTAELAQLPESGRGMAIMRACVDDVSLRSGPGQGTIVQLRKRIELRDDAPLANLAGWELKDAG
jgi:anti-sigma regulatory factor (Ser/Thr protein kinase)